MSTKAKTPVADAPGSPGVGEPGASATGVATLDTTTVRRWKRYPEYRPAMHWFAELPATWRIVPLKHTFRIINGATPQSTEPTYWDGDIPWATPDDLGNLIGDTLRETGRQITRAGYENCGTTIAPPGSLLLSTRAPIGHLAISGTAMCTNQGCRSLVFKTAAEVRFFYYALRACKPELQSLGRGSTFVELSRDELASLALPVPPLPEQRAIAAFLDRETARIDALIGHKERLIALLEEKRQAVISHAVTRGLDPSAPLKDSGIPWLGMVPEHWTIDRLKHRLKGVTQGWSPQCESRTVEPGEWGVLKVGCMNSGIYDESECKALPADLTALPELEIRVGDVLMSRSNTVELVGMTGIVHQTQGRILLCDKLYRLDIKRDELVPEFAVFVLRSAPSRNQIEPAASGASPSMRNISADIVRNLVFAFPPVDEQRAIAAFIKGVWGCIDRSLSRIRDGIARLQEYRTALISAAVTGQIDVRGEVETGEPGA